MFENTGVFRQSLSLERGLPLSQAEVKNLKNTVWKTPFGTLRNFPDHFPEHPCTPPSTSGASALLRPIGKRRLALTQQNIQRDNNFALSNFYCHGVSHEKQRVWKILLSAPYAPPPSKAIF